MSKQDKETLEEQREHFQSRLRQAQHYIERLRSEHQQVMEHSEARYQAAVNAANTAQATAAVIDLNFKRDELEASLDIAKAKVALLNY